MARAFKLDWLIRDASFLEYIMTETFNILALSDADASVKASVAMATFPEALSPCDTLLLYSSISDQLKLTFHLPQSSETEVTDNSSIIKPCPCMVSKSAMPSARPSMKSFEQYLSLTNNTYSGAIRGNMLGLIPFASFVTSLNLLALSKIAVGSSLEGTSFICSVLTCSVWTACKGAIVTTAGV